MDKLKAEIERKKAERAALKASAGGSGGDTIGELSRLQQEKQRALQLELDARRAAAKEHAHATKDAALHSIVSSSTIRAKTKDERKVREEAEEEEVRASKRVKLSPGDSEDAKASATSSTDAPALTTASSSSSSSNRRRKHEDSGVYQPGPGGSLPITDYANETSWDTERIVRRYFKLLLQSWEYDLCQREVTHARSTAGRKEDQAYAQCMEHIQPLFKLCKAREVPQDILAQLLEIVKCSEQGNFKMASDHYLQAAIGNAPWPIGLTMVGIHERSGREKISTAKVAHVMNNELQRKYFTSVKRLITYAQNKRQDGAPGIKVR